LPDCWCASGTKWRCSQNDYGTGFIGKPGSRRYEIACHNYPVRNLRPSVLQPQGNKSSNNLNGLRDRFLQNPSSTWESSSANTSPFLWNLENGNCKIISFASTYWICDNLLCRKRLIVQGLSQEKKIKFWSLAKSMIFTSYIKCILSKMCNFISVIFKYLLRLLMNFLKVDWDLFLLSLKVKITWYWEVTHQASTHSMFKVQEIKIQKNHKIYLYQTELSGNVYYFYSKSVYKREWSNGSRKWFLGDLNLFNSPLDDRVVLLILKFDFLEVSRVVGHMSNI
jgi:hypothetical protein